MMKTTIKKAISLTTVVCFLMAESVSAAPAVGITLMPQRETPAFLQIEIPEELASVEEIYEAPPKQDPRLIIHIQNAHSHYEAQMKIKKLLEYLREQYGFTLFFVEGAAEKLDPKYLDLFPEKEKNLELADQLTKKGQLTGIDYYLMDDPGKSVALGIEKADLYRQDIRAFRDVQSSRDLANAFFDDFERQMETIGSRRFGEDLRRLLGEWKKFEQGRRDFLPHVKRIARDAKRIMGLDLESLFAQVEWPHVTRLLVLQSMEKEIDFEKAEKEKADLIQFLEQIKTDKGLIEDVRDLGERKISMARMTASGKEKERMPRYLLERLVEEAGPKGFYFHDFPAFSLYAGYLILKSELETRALFSEIERIFTKLLDELAVREEEKNLLEIHRDLDLLKKLMQLELTREDWTRTDYRKEWINPRTMARRLESIRDLGVITKEQKARSALMDQGESLSKPFDRAFDFYRYAQERERNFYQTISKEMDERHIEKAVLITGGFHTEGLMDMFREGEINYGVLMPKITTKGDAANYLNAMLETDSTIFDFATIEIISRLQSAAQMTLQDADLTHQVKVVVDAYFRVLQEVGVRDYDTWRRYIQYFNDSPYAQENKIRVVAQSEGLDSAMIEVNGRPIQTPSGENALLQFKLVKPNMWADEVTMVVSVSGVQKLAEQVQSRRRTMPQGLGNIGKPISSGLKQGAMVRETVVDIGSVTVEAGTLVAKRSEFREQGAQVLQMGDSIFVSKQIADWMASQNLLNETRTPGDIQVMQGATRLGFASQEVVSTLTQAWSIASSHSGLWEGSVPGLQYGNDIFVSSQVADWMTKEGLLSKESIPDGFRIMLGETLIGFASRS
ncbi:MAG: hypothetical protein JW893_03985, partial [Candidatus Omnitrophica bacterium]|nr:hypothetical protein [Candidatus Omnitrophota bacterium]